MRADPHFHLIYTDASLLDWDSYLRNNDGHFIGIEECSSVHKEVDGSYIKRQTTVVAYFNRQKGGETFTRLLYGSLQTLSNTSSDKAHSLEVHLQFV